MTTSSACSRGLLVETYHEGLQPEWDAFVSSAKNATFLFCRGFMGYHSDRFKDASLLVRSSGGALLAVLPANAAPDGTIHSHQGLTYGGLVLKPLGTLIDALESLHAILEFLQARGIHKLIYKRIPAFYNPLPDGEVDYGMFLLGSKLFRRECSIAVLQSAKLPFQKRRQREITQAAKSGITFVEEKSFEPFWKEVLCPRLEGRYGVKPVHSLEEITLLGSRFPENIRQFSSYKEGRIVAGTTVFETPLVAHAQYIAVSDEGQEHGALDALFGWLIRERYLDKKWFDFGTCNESAGLSVNQGLLAWKEGFGGRVCPLDFYEVETSRYRQLESALAKTPPFLKAAPTAALPS